MTRQEANREILNHVSNMIEQYPDLRFGQILAILNIIEYKMDKNGNSITKDPFNIEPTEMLKRINHG